MRNLSFHSPNSPYFKPKYERCNILYNWIYNSIKENKVTENVIKECFDEYEEVMSKIRNYNICSKHTYEKIFEEPIKMTILQIFENNMEIIKNELIGQTDPNKIPWRKFVCECFNIYKNMNKDYCLNKTPQNEKHTRTCQTLDQFKLAYEIFRNKIGYLNTYIPSLENIEGEYLTKCSQDKLNPPLEVSVTTTEVAPNLTLEDALPSPPEVADSSIKKNITTTIGTVAGASSILALLYKFSPARRWVDLGIGGSRNINNDLYTDAANEIMFEGLEHGNFNSYNIRYEAA
ncbi:hypothetical protein PVT01_030030000 [Plasmodium vivax]|uniref:VIR protein n=1 Tax=Plasmodium vivax TaxID=5855 RepID=A0A1G4GSC9_PLAVI|nr:hypothetical protein PVT01_030030000 [Plasmodium vivax]